MSESALAAMSSEDVRREREASLARQQAKVAPPSEPAPETAKAEPKKPEEDPEADERAALKVAEIPFAALWPILKANRNHPIVGQILEVMILTSERQRAYLLGKSDGMKEAAEIFERIATIEAPGAQPSTSESEVEPSDG